MNELFKSAFYTLEHSVWNERINGDKTAHFKEKHERDYDTKVLSQQLSTHRIQLRPQCGSKNTSYLRD